MVACYPSPAGATESLLDLETWDEIRRENPVLASLAPDVEALLVNRVRRGGTAATPSYFLVPDRPVLPPRGHSSGSHWRGFTGGSEVWEEIDGFFADLGGGEAGAPCRT